jgi:hypothetical protein
VRRVFPILIAVFALAGCGSSADPNGGANGPVAHPQAVEPVAGSGGSVPSAYAPVGDTSAHAPPLSEVRSELKLEIVAARITNAAYTDPLQYVTRWERTDQGVDAVMPVGAPILAPSEIKILDIEPDWYAGQPLVYFELLAGQEAGQVQYVAEQITDIAKPGLILQKGQVIARFASRGTAIEYGWSTPKGITLAVATTGYEEGEITPAGRYMRAWLNSLGANAGPNT